MKQEKIDEFKRIYLNNQTQKIIPFLQELTAKERKDIASYLRSDEYAAHQEKNNGIIQAAALICCTKSQYKRVTEWYYQGIPEFVDEVLEWQCPDWLSDHYNELAKDVWTTIDYDTILRWQIKGYLQPGHELIAKSLAIRPQAYDNRTQKRIFEDHFIERHPLTLNEHIWSLFYSDSSISFQDNYYNNEKGDGIWTRIFKKYTTSGQIDRMRVLRECLMTVTQDFRREHSGFFAGLFAAMSPIPEELLIMQEELFATFNGKYTKLTNKALDAIKQIAGHQDFQFEVFLTHLPLLLSSETKSIVTSTLLILHKMAKSHPAQQEHICCGVATAFFHKDKSIQSKAAGLIKQYGSPDSEKIRNAIAPYVDVMLMDIKSEIEAYLENKSENRQEVISLEEPAWDNLLPLLSDECSVNPIGTVEDLIFFLSRVFKENNPLNTDLLADALLRLTPQITSSHLNQLKIALQDAYDLSIGDPYWHQFDRRTNRFEGTHFWGEGQFKRLTALFFINYCQFLYRKFPHEGTFIRDLHKEAMHQVKNSGYRDWFKYGHRKIVPLKDWYGKDFKLLQPYLDILQHTLSLIANGHTLPILSTPTHEPAWIEPSALAERTGLYRRANVQPDSMDLQLALSRCVPEAATEKESYLQHAVKKHCSGYSWKIGDQKETDSTYTERPVIEIEIPPSPWGKDRNLYAGISDQIRYYIAPGDISYLCMMYPSVPDIPYALLVKDRFRFAQIANAETRDMLLTAVSTLYETKVKPDAITSLFLACCMLCSEKNIRNYAAEIWIERTTYRMLDNHLFGLTIGQLLSTEWAPVKRFTDLAINQLSAISTHHNLQLEQVITAILPKIKQPVTNLKKILELYSELLSLNGTTVRPEQLSQLTEWEKESNLKKIIKQIKEKTER